ncbi:response regulator transcription factor [Pseudolabrys taiwanensis]|nr:response regulator transcription factor [Pseudolabrys taiwanensis]
MADLERRCVSNGLGMTGGVATAIIAPHLLVRETLVSVVEGYCYRVVCGIGSVDEVANTAAIAGGGPRLVILGEQSIAAAIDGAAEIRRRWPDSKIVLLFAHASPEDVQRLLLSEIDGCVPSSVSPDTLIRALDVVMSGDGRVMILASSRQCSIQPPMRESREIEVLPAKNGGGCASSRLHPRLSGRETQILDGLVRGQTNKVIARACDITEATVKVHMKSILRKIKVTNRTQAAIWALEHGYSADEIKDRLLRAAEGAV